MGTDGAGSFDDVEAGYLTRLCLGGTGLTGCYPSAKLKMAGDEGYCDRSYANGSNPLSGVRGE